MLGVAGVCLGVNPQTTGSELAYFTGFISGGASAGLIARAFTGRRDIIKPPEDGDNGGGDWGPDTDPAPIAPTPNTGSPDSPEFDIDQLITELLPETPIMAEASSA